MDYSLQTPTLPKDTSAPLYPNKSLILETLRVGIEESGSTEDKSLFNVVAEGQAASQYWNGESSEKPLEGNRFTEIKKGLIALKDEGITILGVIGIVSQILAIAQSYFNYLNNIIELPIAELFPYQSKITPFAMLYLNSQTLEQQYDDWKNSKDFEDSHQKFFKMLSTLGSMGIYLLALADTTSIKLKTALLALTFYDLLMNDHISRRDSELARKPPKVIVAY